MPRFRLLPLAALVLAPLGCQRIDSQPKEDANADEKRSAVAQQPEPMPIFPAVRIGPRRGSVPVAPAPHERLPVAPTPHESVDPDLTHDDIGLDATLEAALPEIERLDRAAIEGKVTDDRLGQPDVPKPAAPALAPPGSEAPGRPAPGPTDGPLFNGFGGRSGPTKSKLLREAGGNAMSERAVALGLAWLARQQKADGSWAYDQGNYKEEVAAATGMALVPFLAAGFTHKPAKDKDEENKYMKTVGAGLQFLVKMCPVKGQDAGRISKNMYAQAIATLALVEAYGMTKDADLKPHAQAAIDSIMRAQGPNGSWGYTAACNGDTSIVGWQVQALQAAKLSGDLVIDDRVIRRAVGFLNAAGAGPRKAMYGYADTAGAAPGTALTAVGLLCRYTLDGWGPNHPGMIEGVGGLAKSPPVGTGGVKNLYYYYYATQVVYFTGGEDWEAWNDGPKQADGTRKNGMRDWLVGTQVKKDAAAKVGSWDPEAGMLGTSCGRLGTTAVCLLTLEVYYRHLPLDRTAADAAELPKDGRKDEPKR
jgi:hypothetical protein